MNPFDDYILAEEPHHISLLLRGHTWLLATGKTFCVLQHTKSFSTLCQTWTEGHSGMGRNSQLLQLQDVYVEACGIHEKMAEEKPEDTRAQTQTRPLRPESRALEHFNT